MKHRRAATVLVVASALTSTSACEDLEASLDFENQTDETVWVGYDGAAPDGFVVPDSQWTEASARERVVISQGGGCLIDGEFVIATEPAESAVIDARPLDEPNELCMNDVWKWSGVGDHD